MAPSPGTDDAHSDCSLQGGREVTSRTTYPYPLPQLTLTLDTLMGYAVQQHAALIAKSGRGVGGRDPAMLDLGTVRIEIRILAGALEDNKLAAFLMYIEATFYSERERDIRLSRFGVTIVPTLALKALLAKAPGIVCSNNARRATIRVKLPRAN